VLPGVFHVVDHLEAWEVSGRRGRKGRVKGEGGGEGSMVQVKGEIERDHDWRKIEGGGSQGVNKKEIEHGWFVSRGTPPGRHTEGVQTSEVLRRHPVFQEGAPGGESVPRRRPHGAVSVKIADDYGGDRVIKRGGEEAMEPMTMIGDRVIEVVETE
jgi:hypothetical protein